MKALKSMMYDLTLLMEEVDGISSRLPSIERPIFGSTQLRKPKFTPPELGFLRCVSYCYALLWDGARTDLQFLQNFVEAEGAKARRYLQLLGSLRTYMQHNLDSTKLSDNKLRIFCESWFENCCGTGVPDSHYHWKGCVSAFVNQTLEYVRVVQKCLRHIETSDDKEVVLLQWNNFAKRHPKPHEFDRIIEVVASDMGRNHLDIPKLRRRYFDRWVKHLEALASQFDFEVVVRKLVEMAILESTVDLLPICGSDILDEFHIQPGPLVGSLLELSREIYLSNKAIGKEQLVTDLRAKAREQGLL